MIVSLIKPQKLDRLFDDFNACEKILKFICKNGRIKSVGQGPNNVILYGFFFDPIYGHESETQCRIIILFDGSGIYLNNEGNQLTFKLMKFIQELGYDI